MGSVGKLPLETILSLSLDSENPIIKPARLVVPVDVGRIASAVAEIQAFASFRPPKPGQGVPERLLRIEVQAFGLEYRRGRVSRFCRVFEYLGLVIETV